MCRYIDGTLLLCFLLPPLYISLSACYGLLPPNSITSFLFFPFLPVPHWRLANHMPYLYSTLSSCPEEICKNQSTNMVKSSLFPWTPTTAAKIRPALPNSFRQLLCRASLDGSQEIVTIRSTPGHNFRTCHLRYFFVLSLTCSALFPPLLHNHLARSLNRMIYLILHLSTASFSPKRGPSLFLLSHLEVLLFLSCVRASSPQPECRKVLGL